MSDQNDDPSTIDGMPDDEAGHEEERCSECGGEIVWFDPSPLRTLDPDMVSKLETLFGPITNTSRAWMCQACEDVGIVGPGHHDPTEEDVVAAMSDVEICDDCGEIMAPMKISALKSLSREIHDQAVEMVGQDHLDDAFATVCEECGLVSVHTD